MIKIATTEWFGWLRDVCFLWKHSYIVYQYLQLQSRFAGFF